jgi:hypothetical protein
MTTMPILEYYELREARIKINTGTRMGENRKGSFRSEPKNRNAIDEGFFYNFVLKSGEHLKR